MAIDSHSHIFEPEFEDDIEEVLERAKEANINKIVLVGFNHEGNLKAYKMAQDNIGFLYNTAGLHPDQTNYVNEEDIGLLERFILEHKVYAIGEIGLDYHWEKDNHDKQKWLFICQLELAKKYQLPVVIHSRDADQDTFDILKKYKDDIKFVMHCYSGSVELAKEYIKIGAYISLGGPITFKNAKTPKEVCAYVPLDRFMVETDCPYMAPTPYRGKRNESSYVTEVIKEASNIKGITYQELEKVTEENAIKFFGLD